MSISTFSAVHKGLQETLFKCYNTKDVDTLKRYSEQISGNGNDKKTILDQAFRDVLLTDKIIENTENVEALITLSIAACRADIATATIPVVLMSDIFETVTLDQCEKLFSYVERNVAIWKENWFFTACKNNLLRLCNDLLKRFSRAQNTVFCGRIQLFLATFFPFSERSGLNIVSEFNLENITEFDTEAVDDVLDSVRSENIQLKIDYNLYSKFWALQDFYRNPNQCYDPNNWKKFASHISSVLSAFSSFKLEEQQSSTISNKQNDNDDDMQPMSVEESQHFFAKFLTNPKLLALQLSDANFRRSILVQCLILFQYLTSTVKFKSDSHVLTPAQNEFLKETEVKVHRLLEETPPNGKKFSQTVRHMLKREEMWNIWKNDGCKEFKRPAEAPIDDQKLPEKKIKRNLGDIIQDASKQNKFFMGNTELTRLWNICPDNLQACRGSDRNFLPPFESYLENQQTENSYEWRALRLLARQSPLFFSLTTTNNKVSEILETIRKKVSENKFKKTEVETKNDGDNDLMMEKEDGLVEEDNELMKTDQLMPDDTNTHKDVVATEEQLRELCVIIGSDWERLGLKLGFNNDELMYIGEPHPKVDGKCRQMISNWLEEETSSLEDLNYIMEGLKMVAASKYLKGILSQEDTAYKMEDVSE